MSVSFRVRAAHLLLLIAALVCTSIPSWALSASAPAVVHATVLQAASNIPNLAQVGTNFYRGGMPNEAGLQQLKAAGVTTVVSLANEKQYRDSERAFATKAGLRFIYIPLSPWRKPKQNEIDAFLAVVDKKDANPVFVHCLHGQDRTGAMVAIYRIQHDGWSADEAYAEMKAHGFHRIFVFLTDTVFDFGRQIADGPSTAV